MNAAYSGDYSDPTISEVYDMVHCLVRQYIGLQP